MLGWVSGLFLGWSVGANDTANCFGTAVASRMVPWRVAALLTTLFVIAGAWLQGEQGILTLRHLAPESPENAVAEALAAAITVGAMTLLRLPVSSSHAIVGAILGAGLLHGKIEMGGLSVIVACWIGTPIGAMVIFVLLHTLLRRLNQRWRPSLFTLDPLVRAGLVAAGCYAAYALGANNVANVATVFVARDDLSLSMAALAGGVAISFGTLTFSRPVIQTVGEGITHIGSLDAFTAVLAMALTAHLYAFIGVPVSTSHAIIGALLGLGWIRGFQVIRWRTLGHIGIAWLLTPVLAASLAMLLLFFAHLRFVP